MIGQNKDTEFDIENYEDFYAHHRFKETPENRATTINEYVPRFGWAFDVVEEFEPANLLDLGTLDGSFPITISKHFNIPCVGIDLTVDGIAMAQERAKRLDLPCEFYLGTAEEWLEKFAQEGRKFDLICYFELIEHVKDPKVLIKLVDKVLSPKGIVLVSTPAYESALYGADDEKNTCHIRLYTTRDDDYEAKNKHGHVRKATSITKEIGPERIKDIGVYSHLINVRYE